MGIGQTSEDPDEMLHNAAFHHGWHCLLKQKSSSEKEMQFFWKIIICIPSIYRRINFEIVKIVKINLAEYSIRLGSISWTARISISRYRSMASLYRAIIGGEVFVLILHSMLRLNIMLMFKIV